MVPSVISLEPAGALRRIVSALSGTTLLGVRATFAARAGIQAGGAVRAGAALGAAARAILVFRDILGALGAVLLLVLLAAGARVLDAGGSTGAICHVSLGAVAAGNGTSARVLAGLALGHALR